MATYVLIHGSSSDSWYWHRVVPLLLERCHEVVAPTLPSDDEKAEVWPRLTARWPSYDRYEDRSHRNIRVFRLTPASASGP